MPSDRLAAQAAKRGNGGPPAQPVWYRNEMAVQVDVKLGWRDRVALLLFPDLKLRLVLSLSTKYPAGDFKGRVVCVMASHDTIRPLAKGASIETQKQHKE